jgi:hypothetical protein
MNAQTLCAQVAHRLGEPPALIARRGFQPERRRRKNAGPELAAVDWVFCGGQILVAPGSGAIEAECRGCDTAFEAAPCDVYAVTLHEAERPRRRQRFMDLQ